MSKSKPTKALSHEVKIETTGGEVCATLRAPQSYSTRWDIATAGPANAIRAMAGALAVCWPVSDVDWPGKSARPPRYDASAYNALRFGGTVIDDLAAAGVPMASIVRAGAVALAVVQDGLFTEAEVAEAEGFTGQSEVAETL